MEEFSLSSLGCGVSGCLIPLLIVGGAIYVIVRRGFEMKHLFERGEAGTAEVIKKHRRQSVRGPASSAHLRYRFQDRYGRVRERQVAVSEEEYERYQVGDEIEIVYLPDKSRVNAMKSMVELTRSAKSGH